MRTLLALAALTLLAWLVFRALGKIVAGPGKEPESGPGQDDDEPVRVSAASGADTYRIPPQADRSGECWAPPGRRVTVRGYTIPDGMVYTGGRLASLTGHQVEPALINPDLPVDDSASDPEGSSFGYWPSYSRIPPHARATYLGWLARGRRDPHMGIGYVFLFFYGLERRCLADALDSEEAAAEREALGKEVGRLLNIYGNHRAFRRYACRFLEYLDLCRTYGGKWMPEPPPAVENGWDPPLKLKHGLARMAAERIPVPADWALAWALSHHEAKLRTPAKRCEKEFRALFEIRYEEKFGEGMVLENGEAQVVLTYEPASASFGRTVSTPTTLCDVFSVETQVRPLCDMVALCQEELDGYSRLLGRDPNGRDSLPALAVLPAPLVSMQENRESASFKGWLRGRLGENDLVAVDSKEFIQRWPTRHSHRMLKTETVLLAQLLEKWRLGLEPDPRFGGHPLRAGEKAMIFRLGDNGSRAASEDYLSARILVHLAAMVSRSEGEISREGLHRLDRRLGRELDLTCGEVVRLRAHFRWLLEHPKDLARARNRVETLPEEDRRGIGQMLMSLAEGDGAFYRGQARILTRIREALRLDPAEFSVSNLPSPGSDGPAETDFEDAVPIPESAATGDPRSQSAAGVVLDMDRLRRIREDTAKVSAILARVFSDEEDPPSQAIQVGQTVAGLDRAHSALFKALGEKEAWPRTEFEELAARWGLLPEGALESLNEAAWDIAGGALCEDEDPIPVDRAVFEEMLK